MRLPFGFRRWITFNLVGVSGVAVQLAVLTGLLTLDLHYLSATGLAVEAAVLNNFFWHEHWTWNDRTEVAHAGRVSRLVRFNLTVGSISIAQNLIFMKLFVGYLGVDYLAGNLCSITVCSLINYFLSDRLVFPHPRQV